MIKTIKYIPRRSFVHSLDPRTKIITIIVISVLAFIFSDVFFLSLVLIGIILLALISRISLEFVKRMHPIFIFDLIILVIVPLSWPGAPLSVEGVLNAIKLALVFTIISGATVILAATTTFEDLALAMIKMGIPYKIAFATILAIRFVPVLANEANIIAEAQASRGLKRSGIRRLTSLMPIFLPLVIRAFSLANSLGMVLEMRGFGAKSRTFVREIRMRKREYIVLTIMLTVLMVGIWLRICGYGTMLEFPTFRGIR